MEFDEVPQVLLDRAARVVGASEIEAMASQCRTGSALCLACDDGLVVLQLIPRGSALELFVWLAVAIKHGAFFRHEPAILAIARDLSATTIAFTPRRRGWARMVGPQWARRGQDFVRFVDGQEGR